MGCNLCINSNKLKKIENESQKENSTNNITDFSTNDLSHYYSETPTKGINSNRTSNVTSVSLDEFQPLKLLGKGSYGKVVLVKYYYNDKIYAMKILDKEEITKRKVIQQTKTERKLLEKLDHPFLLKLIFSFQDKEKLYLITDFMQGGELYFHLKRSIFFKESKARFYSCEILLALQYLHEKEYIYRDLKPENILLDKNGHIKIADFGLSKLLQNGETSTNTMCGTVGYIAPEVFLGKSYDKSCDWYSFGVLLYEMLCGYFPIENRKINIENFKNDIKFPENVSENAKDLILKLMKIEPKERLGYNSVDEIINHPFFNGVDFDKVLKKEYKVPFRPKLQGEMDLKYFDINFTEDSMDSYEDEKKKKIINIENFDGFSYCNEEEIKNEIEESEDDDL